MNTLLILLILMASQESSGFPYPEFAMECYPKMAMPGDTVYFVVTAKNSHAKSIYIADHFWHLSSDIQVHLRDSDNQNHPLLFEAQTSVIRDRILEYTVIQPGMSRIIGALSINIPALEDIREPFWEKHLKDLSADGREFRLRATVISYSATNRLGDTPEHERLPISLEIPITIKPRPENEMAMIEDWHNNTPKELFPAPAGNNSVRKVPREGIVPKSEVIRVQNAKYSHWHFIRLGNRYPADPNAPETWQGWKELEESITPSTMRDEIRLTRILIQYCDTEDAKVLTELKEWFAGMNEVQRTVMAKNVCDLAWGAHGTKLYEPYKKIYTTVKEYDIAPKPDHLKKSLEDAGF